MVKKKQSSSTHTNKKAKAKLGHDPLAWISSDDAQQLGIEQGHADEGVRTQLDINPDDQQKDSEFIAEQTSSDDEITTIQQEVSVGEDVAWGLFENDTESVQPAVKDDITNEQGITWGLFDDEPVINDMGEETDIDAQEGAVWGLFENDGISSNDDSEDIITLPSIFNIAEVDKVYLQIENLLNSGRDIKINTAAVESIDAAGVQLLFVFQQEAKQRGINIHWLNESDSIRVAAKCIFMGQSLNYPLVDA